MHGELGCILLSFSRPLAETEIAQSEATSKNTRLFSGPSEACHDKKEYNHVTVCFKSS